MNQYGNRKSTEKTYTQQIILSLKQNPYQTKAEIAASLGMTEQRVREYIAKMKRKQLLHEQKIILLPGMEVEIKDKL